MKCPYCKKEIKDDYFVKVYHTDYFKKRTGTFDCYHPLCWENLQMMVEDYF